MRRRTISARNSEAPLSFFLGAELDLVVFLFSAAALAGLICDPSFLASRAGVTGCPRRVRVGTMGKSDDFDRALSLIHI